MAGIAGAIGGTMAFWLIGAIIIGLVGLPDAGGLALLSAIAPLGGIVGAVTGIMLTLRLKGGLRRPRDLAIHGALVLTMLLGTGGALYHLQSASLSHLGLAAHVPAMEFEIRVPARAADADRNDVQVELRTDRNEALAQIDRAWQRLDDGRAVLRGEVALAYQTRTRNLVLSLPGQPSRLFRLRLAERPSASALFGPWHHVDAIARAGETGTQRASALDGFAIRYRVM